MSTIDYIDYEYCIVEYERDDRACFHLRETKTLDIILIKDRTGQWREPSLRIDPSYSMKSLYGTVTEKFNTFEEFLAKHFTELL